MKWFNLGDSVNLFGFVGAFVIVALTIFVTSIYINKMKTAKQDGKLSADIWDGIGKFENNIPTGWALCFLIAIVWGVWYIFLKFPLNYYSQIGEYNAEVSAHNEKYQKVWDSLSDEQLSSMGENIFLVQCSQCHGISSDGMNSKAANLTLWSKEQGIAYVIKNGSFGLGFGEMPATELSDQDALAVGAYVMSSISKVGKTKYIADIDKGKEVFNTSGCAACHGDDGKGNEGMAPDLTTYGTPDFLALVLKNGKKGAIGHMPSFNYANFGSIQIKALSNFINSLEPISK